MKFEVDTSGSTPDAVFRVVSILLEAQAQTKIPYATKQGIISAGQGIQAQEQGISSAKTEIIAGCGFRYTQGSAFQLAAAPRADQPLIAK